MVKEKMRYILSTLILFSWLSLACADERQVIASVIASESCSEGEIGMKLVSEVIANRAQAWHKTPYEVVTAKNQFYGYTASNRARLYQECQQTADRLAGVVLAKQTGNETRGALYFLAPGERVRKWHKIKTITYRRHTFYH